MNIIYLYSIEGVKLKSLDLRSSFNILLLRNKQLI